MKRYFGFASLLGLVLLISSCSEFLEFFGSCSMFNGIRDGFQISIAERQVILDAGDTSLITLERSWLDENLDRKSLNCSPSWLYAPEGVVEVARDNKTVTGFSVGIARVTAQVTGAGGTKSASFWAAVVPLPNEDEPNNGIVSANLIANSGRKYGYINYSGDVDYFFADVPSGRGFQFTLGPSLNVTPADPFFDPDYRGNLFNQQGVYIGDVNRSHQNDTGATLRVFVGVHGPQEPIPYKLEFHHFPLPGD